MMVSFFGPNLFSVKAISKDDHNVVTLWRVEGRGNQYVVVSLRREFRYGVTTADEALRPISPSKLKYPPHPSGRRY